MAHDMLVKIVVKEAHHFLAIKNLHQEHKPLVNVHLVFLVAVLVADLLEVAFPEVENNL